MLEMLLSALRDLVFGRHMPLSPSAIRLRDQAAREQLRQSSLVATETSAGKSAMHAAYEKLIQHLDEHEVRYLRNFEDQSICADFRGQVGMYRLIATVKPDESLFLIYGQSPVRVPLGSRPAIAETIARANFGLKVGKFEMDFDGGDLQFQTAQIISGDSLDDETIRRLFGTAITLLDIYLPAVLSVIYGNESPQDAIRCVEATGRSPEDE